MGKGPKKSKKADMKEEKKDFVPGTETEEQFEKVLSLLSDWMKAGIVDFELDTDGDTQFNLPGEMSKLLGTQVPRDLTHKKVAAIIRTEIPALISAGLAKNPRQQLSDRMPEVLREKIGVLLKRVEASVEKLVDKDLKERILLRRTTPGYVIDEVRVIPGTYYVETGNKKKTEVPHLLLEISLERPQSGRMLVVGPDLRRMSFSRMDDMRVAVDLHKDDLKNLIEKLKEIEGKISE